MSGSVMPCHLSGNGRRVAASSVQSSTRTDSSPRRVVMTMPCTPIQSPRLSSVNASKSGVDCDGANSWMRPDESWSVPKASLPCTRRSISRPATVTTVSVSVPGSRSANRPGSSPARASTSKR